MPPNVPSWCGFDKVRQHAIFRNIWVQKCEKSVLWDFAVVVVDLFLHQGGLVGGEGGINWAGLFSTIPPEGF